jgi:hypothetical protein
MSKVSEQKLKDAKKASKQRYNEKYIEDKCAEHFPLQKLRKFDNGYKFTITELNYKQIQRLNIFTIFSGYLPLIKRSGTGLVVILINKHN